MCIHTLVALMLYNSQADGQRLNFSEPHATLLLLFSVHVHVSIVPVNMCRGSDLLLDIAALVVVNEESVLVTNTSPNLNSHLFIGKLYIIRLPWYTDFRGANEEISSDRCNGNESHI